METWNLSVEKWREIIAILEILSIPSKIPFNTLIGHCRTNVYRKAKQLSRKKIPSAHRGIIRRQIRKISNKCRGLDNTVKISILIPRNLCNLIRSNSPPH